MHIIGKITEKQSVSDELYQNHVCLCDAVHLCALMPSGLPQQSNWQHWIHLITHKHGLVFLCAHFRKSFLSPCIRRRDPCGTAGANQKDRPYCKSRADCLHISMYCWVIYGSISLQMPFWQTELKTSSGEFWCGVCRLDSAVSVSGQQMDHNWTLFSVFQP